MKSKRIGTQTVKLSQPVVIAGTSSVVGPKEGEGQSWWWTAEGDSASDAVLEAGNLGLR